MIRTIRLSPADVDEADMLRTVDEKRGRPSDVKCREPKPMIDSVALDHRAIWINEDGKGETAAAVIFGHFRSALADDYYDLGP
jgi:hypothetical protein